MSDTADEQWWQTEENDEVATKPKLWRPLSRAVDGFDLDPAAGCEPTPIADTRYTPEDDGLTSPWFGTVWLNPPFSEKARWYRRFVDQYMNGDVDRGVVVAPTGTDADWFHDWFATADYIVFLDGRGWFHQDGSENWTTMLGLWNPTPKLMKATDTLGTAVKPPSFDGQTTL